MQGEIDGVITHECYFPNWFEKEFPSFTSEEGQKVLEERAEEIVKKINNYFTPNFMLKSENAKYLRADLVKIKYFYMNGDYKNLGKALNDFKTAIEHM